ncbi:MAG: hypothetical protein KDK65_06110, partial [Chlamydiia bacterium]|nr:hypothetical protein [Chlamydiia bacterium]
MSLVYQQTYDALVQPNSPSKGWVQTLVDEVVALFYVYVSPPQVDKIKGLSARTISWLSGDLLKKVDPNDLGAKVRGADPHLASFWGAKQFKLDWISHLGYLALMHLYESQKNSFTDAQIQAMGTKQKIALLAYALEQKGRPDPARQQLGERLKKQVRDHFPNLTEEEAKCLWNLLSKH